MKKVFIDGSAGTTGLRIRERLAGRQDLELLTLPEELRKDAKARKEIINASDVSFLCLPDAAAKEAVMLVENPNTAIIDTSTAHRVSEGWAYGFAELSKAHREAIRNSKRIANPGCHASGFIASVCPLVAEGLIPKEFPLTAYSLTGYSGGGKSLIAEYEDENRTTSHDSHRIYTTALQHKHLPEMQKICGLDMAPVFSPILGDFYSGMATSVLLPGFEAEPLWECLKKHYEGEALVSVGELGENPGLVYADMLSGHDSMKIFVFGSGKQTMLTTVFDNLGKGASGAAIQNMNILLGVAETTGLVK